MTRRGLTLAEVMLALGLLAIVLVVAVGILHAAMSQMRRQEHTTRAAYLAQGKLEELLAQARPSGGQGTFPAPMELYRWSAVARPLAQETGLDHVEVTVEGPAGSHITLATQAHPLRQLWMAARVGGRSRLVRVAEDGTGWEAMSRGDGNDSQPTLSPDASTVVFVSDRGGERRLWSMLVDGRELPTPVLGGPPGASDPAYSPDGRKLACTGFEGGYSQVFVLELARRVPANHSRLPQHEGSPAWSPDGAFLALVTQGPEGSAIVVMGADGIGRQTITQSAGWNATPAWSPDGKTLVFMSNRDGNPELYSVGRGGGHARRLTQDGAYDTGPRISPDGNKIAFMSDRGGGVFRVYTMNLDGTRVQPVAQGRESGAFQRDVTWTP